VYSLSQVKSEHVGRAKVGKSALDVATVTEIRADGRWHHKRLPALVVVIIGAVFISLFAGRRSFFLGYAREHILTGCHIKLSNCHGKPHKIKSITGQQ